TASMDADFATLAETPRRILKICEGVGRAWRYALDLSRALCLATHEEIATRTLAASISDPSTLKACA
ncbi:MAG TPA: hypothetical protein VFI81_08055, partial [Rhodanobacteraceae bacterium]|nr:hypothetical protein [Rhodanobacteraceae bacterium]